MHLDCAIGKQTMTSLQCWTSRSMLAKHGRLSRPRGVPEMWEVSGPLWTTRMPAMCTMAQDTHSPDSSLPDSSRPTGFGVYLENWVDRFGT